MIEPTEQPKKNDATMLASLADMKKRAANIKPFSHGSATPSSKLMRKLAQQAQIEHAAKVRDESMVTQEQLSAPRTEDQIDLVAMLKDQLTKLEISSIIDRYFEEKHINGNAMFQRWHICRVLAAIMRAGMYREKPIEGATNETITKALTLLSYGPQAAPDKEFMVTLEIGVLPVVQKIEKFYDQLRQAQG